MISYRAKRERRDRDSGLVFCWRLPVGNGGTLCLSVIIAGLLAAGLSSVVRVHVNGAVRQPERRGTFVMLESGSPEANALEMLAMEAGPFPARARPSQDPVVKDLLAQAISGWMPAGTAYRPEWQDISLAAPRAADRISPAVVLPPLPDPEASVQPEMPARRPMRPISLSKGMNITGQGPAPDSLKEGTRFLVCYDGSGLITRVTALGATDALPVEAWLLSARVEGGEKKGGWLPMEVGP
jgi:hypothetical protein